MNKLTEFYHTRSSRTRRKPVTPDSYTALGNPKERIHLTSSAGEVPNLLMVISLVITLRAEAVIERACLENVKELDDDAPPFVCFTSPFAPDAISVRQTRGLPPKQARFLFMQN